MADTADQIKATFRKFDMNGDGFISREELQRVLTSIGKGSFDDAAIDALLTASDTNKDGKISYDEFVGWVTQDMQKGYTPGGEQKFNPLDKRGSFQVDYRKLLPERFQVDITDRYDVDKTELGAGGFGKVFIAKDKQFDNRRVAVKRVQKPSGRRGQEEISNLEKEIAVMKELDHPSICKLLATFEEGRSYYFIMELCEGGEVFDRIVEHGYISEKITANIVAQVCSALNYAHSRQICHRDIKPENIVFCTKDKDDLRIKLIDWGLATNFDKDSQSMTAAVGSMTYAAPEVIESQDRKAYTEACDLWSTGVLTYVMLCGKPPFWGSRQQHVKAAKSERYPFSDPPWDMASMTDAKDFVRNLLKAKPANRMPIGDAVTHKWLTNTDKSESSSHSASVLGNLKSFGAQSTFSRMCITAVARQLDHKALKDIHQVFREMDTDGNGVLSMDEIKNGLSKMNCDVSNIEELFRNLDMDGSNQIDYTEFCAAGLGEKQGGQQDMIWAAFKTFDIENTGYITTENLKKILDNADIKDVWSESVCAEVGQEIVTKFDKDGDGKISFEDWQELMSKCWAKSKSTAELDVAAVGISYNDLLMAGGLNAGE